MSVFQHNSTLRDGSDIKDGCSIKRNSWLKPTRLVATTVDDHNCCLTQDFMQLVRAIERLECTHEGTAQSCSAQVSSLAYKPGRQQAFDPCDDGKVDAMIA